MKFLFEDVFLMLFIKIILYNALNLKDLKDFTHKLVCRKV